jgi:hypothetical protein
MMAATPSSDENVRLGAPVVLRDGSRVRIPQRRRSGGTLLARAFRQLSPDSCSRRFLTPMPELSGDVAGPRAQADGTPRPLSAVSGHRVPAP